MKRVLILGCNELTKRLLIELCKYQSYVSGICLASRNKEDCDELRELALSMGVRVTTAGIDMNNVEGAMMMVRIFAPDMVVNLLPAELALPAMDLAIKAKADYIEAVREVQCFPEQLQYGSLRCRTCSRCCQYDHKTCRSLSFQEDRQHRYHCRFRRTEGNNKEQEERYR